MKKEAALRLASIIERMYFCGIPANEAIAHAKKVCLKAEILTANRGVR